MASQTKLNLSNTKFEQTSGSTLNLGGNLIANSFSATTFSLVSVPQVGASGDTILARGIDGSIKQISQNLFIPRLLEKKEIPDSTYTLLESDSSKLLIFLNECDVTLPNSIPEDLQFTAANYSSTGATTFNAEGTLNSSDGNVLEGQYAHAYFYKRNATTYVGILPGEGGSSSGSTGLQESDINTLAKLNAIVTDATLVDTNEIVKTTGTQFIAGEKRFTTQIRTPLIEGNSGQLLQIRSNSNIATNLVNPPQLINEISLNYQKEDSSISSDVRISGERIRLQFRPNYTTDPTIFTELRLNDEYGSFRDNINQLGFLLLGFGETNFNDATGADYSTLLDTAAIPKAYFEEKLVNVDKGAGFIEVENHISINSTVTTGVDNLVLSIPLPEDNSISINLKNFLIIADDGTTKAGNGYGAFNRRTGENIREIGADVINTNSDTDAIISIQPNTTANTVEVIFTNDTVAGKVFDINLSYNYIMKELP